MPETIKDLKQRLGDFTADMETIAANSLDSVTIGDRIVTLEKAVEALGWHLDTLPQRIMSPGRFPLSFYRGLRFGLVLHPHFAPDVYLQGAATRQSMMSRDHHGPRAILNAVERLAKGYDSDCNLIRQDLAIAESQLRDYQTRFGTSFIHETYLSTLTDIRDRLKACLSASPPPADSEAPSAADLAEQIKTLTASHRVDETPQRIGRRRVSVEEPVTVRIRRQTESQERSTNEPGNLKQQ